MDKTDISESISGKILSALMEIGKLSPKQVKTAERVKSKLSPDKTMISILKELNYAAIPAHVITEPSI